MAGVAFKTFSVGGTGLQASLMNSGSASKESLLEASVNLSDDASRASKVWREKKEEFLVLRKKAVSLYLRTNNSVRTQEQVDVLHIEFDDLRSQFLKLAAVAASTNAQNVIMTSFTGSTDCMNNTAQPSMEPSSAETMMLNNGSQWGKEERVEAVAAESGVVGQAGAFRRSGSSDSSRRASTGSVSWCASSKAAVQAAPKPHIFQSVATMKEELEKKTSRRRSWPPATHTPTDVPEVAKGSHVLDRIRSLEEERRAVRSTPSPVKTVEVVPDHQHVAELVQVLAASHRDEQVVHGAEDMPPVVEGQHVQDRVKLFGGGLPRGLHSATPSPPPPAEALSPPASEQQEQEPREVHAPSSAATEHHHRHHEHHHRRRHHEAEREMEPAAPIETTPPTPTSPEVSSPQTIVVVKGPVILASEACVPPTPKQVKRVLLVESPVHIGGSVGMVEAAVSQQMAVEGHDEAAAEAFEAEKADSSPSEKAGSTGGGWLRGVSWRSAALAATVVGTGVVVLLAVKSRRRR